MERPLNSLNNFIPLSEREPENGDEDENDGERERGGGGRERSIFNYEKIDLNTLTALHFRCLKLNWAFDKTI